MHHSEALKHKVITDPKWLFASFSAFVTMIPPIAALLPDWDRVREEGIMSWRLAKYRLTKAGVKPSERPVVVSLLESFHIICQRLKNSHTLPADEHKTEYFVPSTRTNV